MSASELASCRACGSGRADAALLIGGLSPDLLLCGRCIDELAAVPALADERSDLQFASCGARRQAGLLPFREKPLAKVRGASGVVVCVDCFGAMKDVRADPTRGLQASVARVLASPTLLGAVVGLVVVLVMLALWEGGPR